MKNRSLLDLAERISLRFIMNLPAEIVLRPLGSRPIVINGLKLHPEMQLYLLIRKLKKKPAMGDLPPIESRLSYVKDSLIHGIDLEHIEVQDFKLGDLNARLYVKDVHSQTVIYYLHGGGFVIGDLDMFDHVCRYISDVTGYKVFTVDYRKAPEAPFPKGIEDGLSGYKWMIENKNQLGISSDQIFIAGDSAGGNLAAVITQIMASEGGVLPQKQLLFYPTCDWSREYESTELFADGFFLTKKDFTYFASHYHADTACDLSHPWISPVHGELKNLPPVVLLTAGFDPLRDQGHEYVSTLRSAGVQVDHILEEGMIHGFINLVGFSKYARSVTDKALSYLKI